MSIRYYTFLLFFQFLFFVHSFCLRSVSVHHSSFLRSAFVLPSFCIRSYFNFSPYFLHCFSIVSPSKRWTIDGQSMDNQWTISEGRTKDERSKNGEIAKDECWISDSAVKSFCSCSSRSDCRTICINLPYVCIFTIVMSI